MREDEVPEGGGKIKGRHTSDLMNIEEIIERCK